MSSEWIDVRVVDGETMAAYLALPDGPFRGGIVLLQEIFGVNAAMRGAADDFAAAGHAVLAPDLFFRQSPRVELDYTDAGRKRGFAYANAYDIRRGTHDVTAAAQTLRARLPASVPVASLGFCLGGKMSVLAAAAKGMDGAVAFYGTGLEQHLQELATIDCPLLLHFGDSDSHIPMATIQAVRERTAKMENVELHLYPGAGHGFYNRFRPTVYDASASRLARERTLDFLNRLPGR